MIAATDPDLMRAEVARRLERAWAAREVAFAALLARIDPSYGTEVFPLAGGHAVLCGPGLFVNRAVAVALERPLTDDDLALLEARAAAVGVPAALEVTPHTDPSTLTVAGARGYRLTSVRTVVAMRLPAANPAPESASPDPGPLRALRVEPLGPDDLALWQGLMRAGAGPAVARASDLFIATSAQLDRDHGFVARDRATGELLGCGLVSVHDGLATLGAMATRVEARRRGVQARLIAARLAFATERGCDLATASAAAGSVSERNLVRAGFTVLYPQMTLTRG